MYQTMFAPGSIVSHFEILEKMGEGGMGAVYKARDQRLDRLAAIKVLSANAVFNQDRQLRFVQEAKSASALNHPNIVTVYEIDTAGDIAFIAMEYIDGRTLDRLIPQKGLRIGEALHYAVQIADALAAAHAAGIIHRDVKPANIMVTEKGAVKVLDFGLAKLSERGLPPAAESPRGESQATVSLQAPQSEEGTIVGTIAYMSPEQAEGKKIDARSDIFAFGAVLYEMLTGRRAFGGPSKLSTMAAILNQEPKPASEIVENFPKELDRVLARCLRKDPARRFQTMADLKVALEELQEESGSGQLTPAAATPERRKLSLVLLAAIVFALLAAGVTWRILLPSAKPDAPLKLIPLTTYPGSESYPTFSPDGSQIAFAWNGEKQDNYDIYVKMVESGLPLRLTTSPESERAPAWSPNGRYIAFLGRNGIYLISPLGGPERKICELTRPLGGLSWSADSKSLAVADRVATTDPIKIFLVSVDTGEKRLLTEPPPQTYGDLYAAFSPDGRTLAFVRHTNQSAGDMFLISSGGGSATRLTSENHNMTALAWTPDGRELIFSSNRSGALALWRLPANPRQGTEPKLVPGATGEPGELSISRAGANGLFRLVYASYTFDSDVWRCELPQCDHPTRLIASTRSENSAQYSPDAKHIVFSSDRSGYFEIWVADAEGGNAVQLTSFAAHAGSPRWSPDGLRIAFDGVSAGNRDIYVIAAQGGSPRRMTTEPSEESRPSFSNDGRWIYFMSDRTGTRQIWKMPSQGGTAVQVTRQGGLEPIESPDGKLLYYVHDRNALGLRSVPVDGGEELTVLESARLSYWNISPTGIYFADFSPARGATTLPLKFYSFQTHNVTEVVKLEGRRLGGGGPALSVSRDDRWALFTRYNPRNSDLFLIENLR